MEVLDHQLFSFFREVIFFMVDDVLPDAAEGGVAVEVFIDLRVLHFAKGGDHLSVGLGKGVGIDEFGQVHPFDLAGKCGLFFVAFPGDRVEHESLEVVLVEIEDDAEALGVAGDRGGDQALVRLYGQANTPALRDAVLQGLLVSGDSDAVLTLYRNAKSVDEKKVLLRTLTTMGDDAAIDAIEAELDKPGKQ